MSARAELDVVASLAAVARASYSSLLTVVWCSVLVVLTAIPVVTLGAGLLALVETVTATVTGENRGGPTTERARFSLFVSSFRANVGRGLPYSLLLAVVFALAAVYLRLVAVAPSDISLLGALGGLYAAVIVPVWVLRAGSVVVRADDAPGFFAAMREGAYVAFEEPTYSALHLVVAGVCALVSVAFVVPVFVLLPGLLAVFEVVVFEDLVGMGAAALVRGYQGDVA